MGTALGPLRLWATKPCFCPASVEIALGLVEVTLLGVQNQSHGRKAVSKLPVSSASEQTVFIHFASDGVPDLDVMNQAVRVEKADAAGGLGGQAVGLDQEVVKVEFED